MENTKSCKNQIILLLVILLSVLGQYCWGDELQMKEEVHVGVIVDMSSMEGKIVESCIAMAISDFYGIHHNYTTRLLLHSRDSNGQHLQALSAALELLYKFKVEAIIGVQTRIESNFLAEIGNKAKLPMVSILGQRTLPPSNKSYSFLVHATPDETSQFKGITALVESFEWRDVILIHGDSDFERDIISYMIDSLQEIFIVHISQHLLVQLVKNAKELGMMSKGYAWVMSATTMNLLQLVDSSVFQSMQGVVGLKSYIPQSKDLHNLTSRLRRKIYIENPSMEVMESSAYGVWAYDSIWAVAEAVERTKVKLPPPARSNTSKSSKQGQGSKLLKEILQTRFRGLSGEFVFKNGRRVSSDAYEIVNVIAILWPGRTTTTPKGRSMMGMNGIKLRIGVPVKIGFNQLVRVDYDPLQSNATYNVTGFCVDVFKAAVELLPYQVEYQFILDTSGMTAETYDDLVYQVYLQNFDAVVGDTTITSNRSLYVDFTIPYTDMGVGMVVPNSFKTFLSPQQYVDALSKGSKHGGISAIIDEIPYIKIFLAMYPGEYLMIKSMSTTNGFGFVSTDLLLIFKFLCFRKGSPLVHDMSWAIEKLREEGELAKLETEWFRSKSTCTSEKSTNGTPDALSVHDFGGLFMISGISSTLALLLFLTLLLKK
ncbi:hypothetical protein FNV43_RR21992 [Rhamnella rubrinervis]|uniref:Ionotropic glutamate receptor C-terminal domain-containing protein n=1 Tax=Rhamnella rubrinervis TaxID=2594499 RepID=A0A8K0GUR4_9ROSA|nr:hypothetical protein FNV43_RR21992 [Rhamnella rubrinervis]